MLMTKFEARAKSLLWGLADHTYVKCPEIDDTFTCFAMLGEGDRLINSDTGNWTYANLIRDKQKVWPWWDTVGFDAYGRYGVCHQAANRILLLTEKQIKLHNEVRGYFLSASVYGEYGIDFSNWTDKVKEKVKSLPPPPAPTNVRIASIGGSVTQARSAEQKGAATDQFIPEPFRASITTEGRATVNDIISAEACHLASPFMSNADSSNLREDIVDMLKEKDGIIKSGIRGEKLANDINGLVFVIAKSLASRLTDSDYRDLIGAEKGEEVLIVDPEIAAKLHK